MPQGARDYDQRASKTGVFRRNNRSAYRLPVRTDPVRTHLSCSGTSVNGYLSFATAAEEVTQA